MGDIAIFIEAVSLAIATIAGGAVAWLFRQVRAVGKHAEAREALCERRLNVHRRRQLTYQGKLIETAEAAGVSVNGPFHHVLQELDAEELDILGGNA